MNRTEGNTPDPKRAEGAPSGSADDLVAWAEVLRSATAAVPLTDPPPLVKQRLRGLWTTARDGQRPAAVLRSLAAALVEDSRLEAQWAGIRSPGADFDQRFQLVYRSDDVDVIVDVTPGPDSEFVLRGQVLVPPGQPPVFEAVARWSQGQVRTILGDEFGGFVLLGVPLAADQLVVSNDLVEVVMPLDLYPETDDAPGNR